MDELKKYTESLFTHQRQTAEIEDLKAEIYSNLQAKKQDLIDQGLSEAEAVAKTKESILSIDHLIEGKQLTYRNRFQAECGQTLLLYALILWILSIPVLILNITLFPLITFLAVILCGVSYLSSKKKNQAEVAFLNRKSYQTIRKTVWLLWLLFFIVYTVTISAVMFASNLWFSRPVQIDGPYQLALVMARYYIPAVTVLLPIAVSRFPKILAANERRDENEKTR